VAVLSDVNSVIVERYSYDVFGEPNRVSNLNNPYLFTGRRYDSESDLYYYRVRIDLTCVSPHLALEQGKKAQVLNPGPIFTDTIR
jgi:hypothetical protein